MRSRPKSTYMLRICAVLLATALLAGCGGGGGSSDVTKIKQTLTRYFSAFGAGDGATACSLFTQAGQAAFEHTVPGTTAGRCAQIVTFIGAGLTPPTKQALESAQIGKINVVAGTATVQVADVTATSGSFAAFPRLKAGSPPYVLTKQPDGSWKIAG